MNTPAPERVASLDLIRGVAVLGILAINIAGFAGPMAAVYTPHAIHPPTPAGDAWFTLSLIVFEGKMRALFGLLFGASLALFVARMDDAGRDGQTLQLRRLLWLALFGYLHYLLLWWGDILFLYAVAGVIVLAMRHVPGKALAIAALLIFTAWQAHGVATWLPGARAQIAVEHGTATPAQAALARSQLRESKARMDAEMAHYRSGFTDQVAGKLLERPFFPVSGAFHSLGETVPTMLIGVLLFHAGFFSGGWPARRLWAMAMAGTVLGGAATAAFAFWAWSNAWPLVAMILAMTYALGMPHLLMALGYAALLVLAAPRLAASRPGARLTAAGRMAFSNYIGTSVVMTALFYGWGLGLIGSVPVASEPLFVLLGWLLMLAWSKPWLARFRNGPLEWLWRGLTEMRRMPLRR